MSDTLWGNDEDMPVIHLELDNGQEEDCAVIAVFEIDGYDYNYIALIPVADFEDDVEESRLFLYRFEEEGDSISLTNIDGDDEYKAVSDAFDAILDENEEEDA